MQSTKFITVPEVIERTKARISQLGINPRKEKYRHLVLQEAENHRLTETQYKQLARHLDIEIVFPPRFARAWNFSLCKIYMSSKYTNPSNSDEFVVLISSRSHFGVRAIVHHTPYGYLDKSWFTTFVPDLDLFAKNYQNALKQTGFNVQGKEFEERVRREFTSNINDNLNRKFPDGMTSEQIKAVNAFFLKYLPDVEGICRFCFKLSLPRSGPGVRWFAPNNTLCEVRLSEPKPNGYPCQQRLYLTHNYQINLARIHVKWNGIVTESPTLTKVLQQSDTHIPWEFYDYADIVNRLPSYNNYQFVVCQCKKTI